MESNFLFSHTIQDNLSQQIIRKIQNGQWTDILNKLCYIKDNSIVLDYIYFKYFAHIDTYDIILYFITSNIDHILSNYTKFIVHVNLTNLTLIDIDKHKSFIQNISKYLKDTYPQKLEKCNVYNAPFVFSQFFRLVSLFIDKDTQRKIQLVSPK
jgi:hypothetical protein